MPDRIREERIRREYEAGRSRGGPWCCGTTGKLHRWFCPTVPAEMREQPTADDFRGA